jgi:hypothetical protein
MNTKFLMSCAALTLLGLGGAATPTNVQARGLSFGANAGRSVIPFASRNASAVSSWNRPGAAGFAPGISKQQALKPDSLLKTTKAGAIGLTEQAVVRNFGAAFAKVK